MRLAHHFARVSTHTMDAYWTVNSAPPSIQELRRRIKTEILQTHPLLTSYEEISRVRTIDNCSSDIVQVDILSGIPRRGRLHLSSSATRYGSFSSEGFYLLTAKSHEEQVMQTRGMCLSAACASLSTVPEFRIRFSLLVRPHGIDKPSVR